MSDHAVAHVIQTTTSEVPLALREMQPPRLPSPPRPTILVAQSPLPQLFLKDVVAKVRGNRARLDARMDALESRFDMLESQFDGLKAMMQHVLESQGLFMAVVKVSIRWGLTHCFLT